MFVAAYLAVMRHYRVAGPWYHDADIRNGQPTQLHFASLQAFWPGVPCPPACNMSQNGKLLGQLTEQLHEQLHLSSDAS